MSRLRQAMPWLDDQRKAVRVSARVALTVVSAALGLSMVRVLEPMAARAYFFPITAATVITAVLAGWRYGLATTVVCGVGYLYFFVPPRGSLTGASANDLAALVAYTATGVIVAGVGGSLRNALERLRRQHEQREDLLRALMHDVRTPLGAILMNAKMLGRAGSDGGDEAVRRRAAAIEKSTGAVTAMLQDLTEAAVLESGHLVLDCEPVDVRDLAASMRTRLAGTLPMDRVNVAVPPDVPPVRADPRRLERILVNLVSNALKYAPGSPVTVRAAHEDRTVVVSVADNGPGIPADALPHIFEKYFRAAPADPQQQSLGLGLYITRLLVQAHGGRIWIDTGPGKGTTFNVALPSATSTHARA